MKKTTKELYSDLNVPRSTFRGWVYKFLDKKQDLNDKTSMEFTEEEVIKLWLVKFYKEIDKSNEKVEKIVRSSNFDVTKSLTLAIKEMRKKEIELKRLIRIATVMKKTGVMPDSVRFLFCGHISGGLSSEIYEKLVDNVYLLSKNKVDSIESFTGNEFDEIDDNIFSIVELKYKGFEYESLKVQDCVKEIHLIISRHFTESIIQFMEFVLLYAPNTNEAKEIDKNYGKGCSEYVFSALQQYCINNFENDIDKKYIDAITKIEKLARNNFSIDSVAVQSEVEKIFDYIKTINKQPDGICLRLMRNLVDIFRSKEFRDFYDNGKEGIDTLFISKAIEEYCNNKV